MTKKTSATVSRDLEAAPPRSPRWKNFLHTGKALNYGKFVNNLVFRLPTKTLFRWKLFISVVRVFFVCLKPPMTCRLMSAHIAKRWRLERYICVGVTAVRMPELAVRIRPSDITFSNNFSIFVIAIIIFHGKQGFLEKYKVFWVSGR